MVECNRDTGAASAIRSGADDGEGQETILLVEDGDVIRSPTQRMLSHLGYRVLVAEGPDAAQQLCDRHDGLIHVLLTDLDMPKRNGRELFETLQHARPELRVVYMSGYANDVNAEHGVLDASAVLLPRPFTLERLSREVKGVLEDDKPSGGQL